jgi:hypothetical protein
MHQSSVSTAISWLRSNQATLTAQNAATSALLVSCIIEYDPTRLGANRSNPLLTPTFCTRLMERIARGAPIAAMIGAAKKAAPSPTASGQPPTRRPGHLRRRRRHPSAQAPTPPRQTPGKKDVRQIEAPSEYQLRQW